MQVTLKLFAALADYLPADGDDGGDNGAVVTVADSTSAHQLIDGFNVPRAEVKVMMVNGVFLDADARDVPLNDGDVVTALPAIQGG